MPATNGHTSGETEAPLNRADEVKDLLTSIQDLIIPFIASADEDATVKRSGHGLRVEGGGPRTTLVEHHPPKKLECLLQKTLEISDDPSGKEGLVSLVETILKYSVNTWDQGFLDKLYGTSNSTAIVIARNTLYPETKVSGHGSLKLTIFTSAHGHYSVEKAANLHGLGTSNVISVPVDNNGQIVPEDFARLVQESKARGETPFFLNATAGTTVHGSFDPFTPLSTICKQHNMWLHIDGSWGGPVIFSAPHASSRLAGAHLADSITINPHKMLGVPMTSSFLLGADMAHFHAALTLPAGYLFHNAPAAGAEHIYDLADLTPQCGRRADALKFFLALQYYGAAYFGHLVATGFANAEYLLAKLKESGSFVTISPEPLPCLQVCFYYAREGKLEGDAEKNSKVTADIANRLISRGFMIDYAPGEKGRFFRVVVNGGTRTGTLDGLVKALVETAAELGY
ncbi:pyridoxal phosphate-dependent transferase [Ampelomyces quisqualis]|uniref:Pyridoxal phosphate-dependent transferase n=1 Tax=Ampelomyces quisqualis TaxID=50730 RepID=A0A6A5R088_AMPQU|nr:pyridoxal phosphate-dependent transferase [Ampelomyces quisqualis]